MSVASIQILEPCNQSWAGMQEKEQGRHCDSCQKTVVDFTTWESDDILRYLQKHSNTCGRFRTSQIIAPSSVPEVQEISRSLRFVLRTPVAMVTRVAAFVLLSFYVVSCGESPMQTKGIAQALTDTEINAGVTVSPDSSEMQILHRTDSGVKMGEPDILRGVEALPISHGNSYSSGITMGAPIALPEHPKRILTPEPEDELMGDVEFVPNPTDTLSHENLDGQSNLIQLPTDKRTLVVPSKVKH